ncbi:MAG: amidohydrolase family protein [Bacteroidales bacterium]|nr:amidohydrolase family protein [Bacteroidales bacterium]
MSLLLKNGTYIDIKNLKFYSTDILVDEKTERIQLSINNPFTQEQIENVQIEDCTGKYIMHSFADGFLRPGLSFSFVNKNYEISQPTYFKYVSNILWNIDSQLDKDLLYASSLYAAMMSAKNGTTFAICRNETSKYIEGSLSTIEEAFKQVGVSTLLSFSASEANGYATAEKIIAENQNYLTNHQGLMGIAASYLASDDLFETISNICKENNKGIIINTAEDNIDQTNTMRDHHKSAITRIFDSGLMDYNSTILLNANYLNDEERCFIKNKPAWIVQNPYGNLERGIIPFNSIWLGNKIMIGSDFTQQSISQCMRMAYMLSLNTDNKISDIEAFNRMNAVHNYINDNNFIGDKENNLIVFSNNTPIELNSENFIKHIAYNFNDRDINLVISDGKIIVKDNKTTLIDEKEVMKICSEQCKRIKS